VLIPFYRSVGIFLLFIALAQAGESQSRLIRGTVIDSLDRIPVENVSIRFKNAAGGAMSDAEGRFSLRMGRGITELLVSATGYQPVSVKLEPGDDEELTIFLNRSYSTLKELMIRAKRGRYRNKNNPAVALIRQVIAHKSRNGPDALANLSYKEYEKIRVLLDRFPPFIVNSRVLKQFHFLFENPDTVLVPGKSLIPVYLEEVVSENYDRKQPPKKKKVVVAHKRVNFGEYLDMKGISAALNRLYMDINLYDNTIPIFTIQFTSPIADLAPELYRFFIRDTVEEDGVKMVKMYFSPRNPEDLLFHGTLFVTLDGNYAVRKASLEVSKHINLNYVREFKINLDFAQGPGGRYHLASSDFIALFSPLPKSPGIFGERSISLSSFNDSLISSQKLAGRDIDTLTDATTQTDSIWRNERSVPLSETDKRTYVNTDSLVHLRSYHRLMDYATVLTAGYKSAGKFDIGPIGSFYSFNPVEGSRFMVGGRSNTKLSTRFYSTAYVAYGLKDQRWKYSLSETYSINNLSIYSFPLHYFQLSYLHDTRNPGQENVFAQGNSFLGSFARGDNSKWLYDDIFRVTYIHELDNHFSFSLGLKYWNQQPAGSVTYLYTPSSSEVDTARSVTSSEVSLTLRWAPHEQFYQGPTFRSDIVNRYPILTFQFARGIKGFLGGQYNYDAFHFNLYKRFYVSPIGYTDFTLDAGLVGGTLPFPLLIIHPANQSYFYTESAYNLMNYEEFVSDHYAGVNIDHFFNGFFFNKIPFLKKLRFREVIAAKVLYGGVRDENNPDLNQTQMKFPTRNGQPTTFALGTLPYAEASVGIYNILSIFRVDLIKRFTYLGHPDISGLGLRLSGNFSF
jgi:hypothetical protein